MSENIYKIIKEKNGKKYVNYYVNVNGFVVAVKPMFLNRKQQQKLFAIVPNKEAK